jgi:hypothetical protein
MKRGMGMNLSKLTVRHGELRAVQALFPAGEMMAWRGKPRTWEATTIVAAPVHLKGPYFLLTHTLADYTRDRELPTGVDTLLLDGYDGPWVRGRIERVFGVTSAGEEERGEKAGLHAEFLAVHTEADGSLVGVPFRCRDHYLKTGLLFSEKVDRPPAAWCDRIADAFWGLLLAEPHDLPEYRDRMFHVGAGVWLVFGIEHGQPFIEEREDGPNGGTA